MKRANGEGTIWFNGVSWVAQFSAPSGRKTRAFPTQRKASAWITQQKRELDTGEYIEPSFMTLSAWWDKWVETYKALSVSPATLESYKYSKERCKPLLDCPISQITKTDIQGLLNGIQGRRRTVEITRTALKMCFDRAVKNGLVRSNPVNDSALPVTEKIVKAHALTKDEESKLIERLSKPVRLTANGEPDIRDLAVQSMRDALLLILWTGIRRGECLSLKWTDIQGNLLHIRGTKNTGSDRRVPLPADAKSMLNRRRFTANSEYIFATSTGQPIIGRNLLKFMKSVSVHNVHDLRHTYCTRAAQAGINPKVLQTITGHRKIETLLKIYTHVTDQDRLDAAAKIFPGCISVAYPAKK